MPTETHRRLRDALDKRQLADCEVRPVLSEDDIEEMEEKAVQFLDAVREYLKKQGYLS